MLNCIVIDDEQFAIDALLKYISFLPKLNVIGIFLNPQDALECVTEDRKIDIIFMDIDMPNLSGIELAAILRPRTVKLIFTTAHSKYAFAAFEAEADAFLFKPFTLTKFISTINRLFPIITQATNSEHKSFNDHFLVKNKDENLRMVNVAYTDVIVFESLNNYVKIHLKDKKAITAYLTIKDILDLLENRNEFKQFHRAFIVNTRFIQYIQGNTIILPDNFQFNIGEKYRDNFNGYLANQLLKTTRKYNLPKL